MENRKTRTKSALWQGADPEEDVMEKLSVSRKEAGVWRLALRKVLVHSPYNTGKHHFFI